MLHFCNTVYMCLISVKPDEIHQKIRHQIIFTFPYTFAVASFIITCSYKYIAIISEVDYKKGAHIV
jgi:hypothetical protein